jgi:hypothetical protein
MTAVELFRRRPVGLLIFILSVLLFCYRASAQAPETTVSGAQPLSSVIETSYGDVETLKQSVLELNRDLLILEEELLFPASTQVSIFLSMDVGEFFQLDAVKLKIDDKLVASQLYTDHQVDALYRGGVQRLYIGNLKNGSHEVSAFFTGKGPQGREYKRGAKLLVDKDASSKMLELRIVDSTAKLQPIFDIKEWSL